MPRSINQPDSHTELPSEVLSPGACNSQAREAVYNATTAVIRA